MAKVTALECDQKSTACRGEVQTWVVGVPSHLRETDLCDQHAQPLVEAAKAATRRHTPSRRRTAATRVRT